MAEVNVSQAGTTASLLTNSSLTGVLISNPQMPKDTSNLQGPKTCNTGSSCTKELAARTTPLTRALAKGRELLYVVARHEQQIPRLRACACARKGRQVA